MTDVVTTSDSSQSDQTTGRGFKPSAGRDLPYRTFLWVAGIIVAIIVVGFFASIVKASIPGWQAAGPGLLWHDDWSLTLGQYGALPLILGTFATTVIAAALAIPISVGAATALAYLMPRRLQPTISAIVELLAVIPSVVYGLWGVEVFRLTMQNDIEPFLHGLTGGHWPFNGPEYGTGLLLGALILAVMIMPTVTAISRDVLAAVPREMVEGALSLGATRSQVLRRVVIPSARSGIVGASALGIGRALGETIAMLFVLGNAGSLLPSNLFAPTLTLAAEIANDIGNTSGPTQFGVLACLALILMVIVFSVNLLGRIIVSRQNAMFSR
jgi:phosphate transport system permease protein